MPGAVVQVSEGLGLGLGLLGAVVQVSEGLQDVPQAGRGVQQGLFMLPLESSLPPDVFWVDP